MHLVMLYLDAFESEAAGQHLCAMFARSLGSMSL